MKWFHVKQAMRRPSAAAVLWFALQMLWLVAGGALVAGLWLLNAPPIVFPFLGGCTMAYLLWRGATEPAIHKKKH